MHWAGLLLAGAALAACSGSSGGTDDDPPPPPAAACTGAAPAHAIACPGAAAAPEVDTPRYVTVACSSRPCSYGCAPGYTLEAGACVAGSPPPRQVADLSDAGDGTLLDAVTGARWLQRPACAEPLEGVPRTGGAAGFEATGAWIGRLASGACGLADGSAPGDWSLPSPDLLLTLFGSAAPSLFVGAVAGPSWSAMEPCITTAITIDPTSGDVGEHPKEEALGAWPVRLP